MALFRPKKDECDICNKFMEGHVSEENFNMHITRKKEARREIEKDKENEKFVYTVDLQAVLLSPKSNISSLYYKTELCVHNLCYFDLNNKDGFCYLWHERKGGLNSEEFSSCFNFFIESHVIPFIDEEKRKIIIWSDGCTYQNRNCVLADVAINLTKQYQITIEHKYLEVGDTQMQVDSMHSTIERRVKSRRINVPAEYAVHCQKARINPRPYTVKYLDHTFLESFKNVETVKSIRPGRKPADSKVTDIRGLKYTPEGDIYYKLRLSEEWTILAQRRQQVSSKTWNELDILHRNKIAISAKRCTDLQDLKSTLLSDYHGFYDNLPHE